jgi:uncharacterized protein (DUF2141 family)
MIQRFAAVLAALLCCLSAAALPAHAATVEVHVTGTSGGRGNVSVAVCDRERFLKQCAYSASVPARDGETLVTLRDVPAGTWAVLAYQDENANGQLDRNLIGIPSENYGFSRDARGRFGPPSFDDAAIAIKDETTSATVRLH